MEYFDHNEDKWTDTLLKGKIGRMSSGSLEKIVLDKKGIPRKPPLIFDNKNVPKPY